GNKMDEYFCVVINAKNSEMHAALGISVLPHVREIIKKNKKIFLRYTEILSQGRLKVLTPTDADNYNYGYFPVLFKSEETMIEVKNLLEHNSVYPRRYFYPSLNGLPFLEKTNRCPVSEDISKRILCLPLYADLSENDVERISSLALKVA
ncbi:MAG: DegT/DnrJ/EryC1/StrS family aminotransferase, partial [Bacteroidota bacterium]